MSQAILLDCRNFDPDAKKGTSRDVEAGCVLAKFEKGQQKYHNTYNNIGINSTSPEKGVVS